MLKICYITFLTVPVHAWTDTGHMLVAKIAHLGLTPEQQDFFDTMTNKLYSSSEVKIARKNTPFDNPGGKTKDDLVAVATWPDTVDMGLPFQKMWHFSDKPVILEEEGCKLKPEEESDSTLSSNNLLELSNSRLSKGGGPHKAYPQDVIYGLLNGFYGITSNYDKKTDPAIQIFQQAFWMRMFVHYMGDVHQPLHASTGCSGAHPNGDMGGNLFKIKTNIPDTFHPPTVAQLHLFWDLAGGHYTQPNWPVNQTGLAFINSESKRLRSNSEQGIGPLNSTEMQTMLEEQRYIESEACDPHHIVREFVRIRDESWKHSRDDVYRHNLEEGEEVPKQYYEMAKDLSEKRLVMAGLRLEAFLKKIYGMITESVVEKSNENESDQDTGIGPEVYL